VILLVLWAGLIIFAFALVYHGMGSRFQAAGGSAGFGTLVYMSASTFLTLGLGDVTSSDPIARVFIELEAGSGYVFLALMITYMPVLEQAYGSREVVNLLIHSRSGHPPSAIKFVRRYRGSDRREVLRSNLRDAERWIAEILQTHLSHPVLSFYRSHQWGESWLVALTTVLDVCALLIAGGDGLPASQARITYRMGLRLLKDLTAALHLTLDPECPRRLTEVSLAALSSDLKLAAPALTLGSEASDRLLRLVERYDAYLFALSASLVIPLPSWHPTVDADWPSDDDDRPSEVDEAP
jgi:hypothetical protein